MGDDAAPDVRVEAVRGVASPLLAADGALDPGLRRAAFDHGGNPGSPAQLPEPLAGFVHKVAVEAYKVVDADVGGVRSAGYSEDAILESVLATAMGAGLSRLEIGLAALAGRGPGR